MDPCNITHVGTLSNLITAWHVEQASLMRDYIIAGVWELPLTREHTARYSKARLDVCNIKVFHSTSLFKNTWIFYVILTFHFVIYSVHSFINGCLITIIPFSAMNTTAGPQIVGVFIKKTNKSKSVCLYQRGILWSHLSLQTCKYEYLWLQYFYVRN